MVLGCELDLAGRACEGGRSTFTLPPDTCVRTLREHKRPLLSSRGDSTVQLARCGRIDLDMVLGFDELGEGERGKAPIYLNHRTKSHLLDRRTAHARPRLLRMTSDALLHRQGGGLSAQVPQTRPASCLRTVIIATHVGCATAPALLAGLFAAVLLVGLVVEVGMVAEDPEGGNRRIQGTRGKGGNARGRRADVKPSAASFI